MLTVPSVYWGNIFYWSSLFKAEKVWIDEGEYFIKQTYRNRAEIATERGVASLIIPLEKGKNTHMPMHEVRISYAENWRGLHFKTLQSAYGRSAYFEHYKPELAELFSQQPEFLCDWNKAWFHFFANEFMLDVSKIHFTKNYIEAAVAGNDIREKMNPKQKIDFSHQAYYHVFFDKYPPVQNLSVMDLLMNEGPAGMGIL